MVRAAAAFKLAPRAALAEDDLCPEQCGALLKQCLDEKRNRRHTVSYPTGASL